MAMSMGAFASRVVANAVVATDGTGDFTDIQTAIDSLPTGGVVYIKEGTYNITAAISVIVATISLIGAGKATKIQSTGDHAIIRVQGAADFTMENLYIYGSGSGNNSNHGLWLNGAGRSFVSHCWIENCGGNGINIDFPSEDNVITQNFIIKNYHHGISITDSEEIVITSNFIAGNDAGESASYDGIILGSTLSVIIMGNVMDSDDRYEINVSDAGCSLVVIIANNLVGDHVGAINDQGVDTQIGHNNIA